MRKTTVLLLLLFISVRVLSQDKPVIDTGMLDSWPHISGYEGNIAISSNGRYVAYVIHNQPVGLSTLVVQDLRGGWKKRIVSPGAQILFFSTDSRQLCWRQGDSLWLQSTGRDQNRLLGVTGSASYPRDAHGEWLALPTNDSAFRLLNLITHKERAFTSLKSHSWLSGGHRLLLMTAAEELKLLDLVNGKDLSFAGVKEYVLFPDEKSMLLLTEAGNRPHLQWVSPGDGRSVTIWTGQTGERPEGYVFDKSGKQVAFTVQSQSEPVAIWNYKFGQPTAILQADDRSSGFTDGLQISGIRAFSGNGRWLFFTVRKKELGLPEEPVTTLVDIWSYRDETLHPAQSTNLENHHDYTAALEINSKKVQLLEQRDDERIISILAGDHHVLRKGGVYDGESRVGSWWPHGEPVSYWLLSLENGGRTLIKQTDRSGNGIFCSRSPNGHWIYYWDINLGHYFSVDPKTGQSVNLTEGLPVSLVDEVEQVLGAIPAGGAGWYIEDSAWLVYDNYDIWKLDPSGRKAAVNITGGYGREYGIKLRLVYRQEGAYKGNEELLLSGYDEKTKYNGFFTIRLDKPGNPALLTMGPYTYYQMTVYKQPFGAGMPPLSGGRGKDKRWIVMRESATEYPNFYVSKDLRQFMPLTDFQPQMAYNWLSTEVVSWRMYNGQVNTGVLYKPENFDPAKKYPVIFNYYEKYAQRCYQFPLPGLTTANINIPWFVSREYLVFTPDIQYTVASKPGGMTTGEAAYNAVASAAEWLSQRSYIDKDRMAIQGHSFGGHETNAIITQTELFAAAAEVAGTSDPVSSYLTLITSGGLVESVHKQDHPQGRVGATPWERPDLYHRNSSVLNADKVTTPLLICHNKRDGSINFRQGVEMYMALRRLGKSCWLLQYDKSGHVLTNTKDGLDYTIRLTQYFDHYLKRKPAPQWMTMNTMAAYKGKNNLYALDPDGSCGKKCKVCKR